MTVGSAVRSSRTMTASEVQSQVGAVASHGNPEVGGGHGRGVVDSVADRQHALPTVLEGVEVRHLVCG